MAENKELGSDIKRLFEGRKVDPNFGYAAVWLSSFAKLDNEVISRAYKEGQEDPKLRTLAVHAMGLVDFSKYRKNIETALFNDFDDNVRMQAIIQMGMNEDINGEIGNRLIAVEKSKSVLVALGKAFTFKTTKDKTILEAAGKLISDRDTDVKLRGYQAYAAHSEDTDLMNMLSNLGGCPPLIKKEVVVELKRSGKLNSPDVATMLSEMAKTDSSIRLTLLGELSLLDHSGANYKPLLEGIMRSKGHSEGERAHAIYLLGRENGSDYLYSNKGHIDMNSKLEREAFLLAYFDSMGKAIKSSSPLPEHSIVAIMPYGESFETYEKFLISMELGKHLNGNGNPAAKVIGPLPPTGANAGNLSSLAAPLRDRERADETSFLSEVPRLFQEKYGTVVNSAKDLLFASRHPLTQIARGEAAPQINVHAAKTKA